MSGKYTIGPDVDLDQEEIYTESGDRLTEAVAQEMAESAIREARAGRPSLTGRREHSPEVSARVSPELREAAKRQAKQVGMSLSKLLRDALEWYLDYLEHGGGPGKPRVPRSGGRSARRAGGR